MARLAQGMEAKGARHLAASALALLGRLRTGASTASRDLPGLLAPWRLCAGRACRAVPPVPRAGGRSRTPRPRCLDRLRLARTRSGRFDASGLVLDEAGSIGRAGDLMAEPRGSRAAWGAPARPMWVGPKG